MSLWRGIKMLAGGIAIYIVVALMLLGAGAVEVSLPLPPSPPNSGAWWDWLGYYFSLFTYPFSVLFSMLAFGLQIITLPGVPFPLNILLGAIVIVMIIYGIIEIVMSILDRISIPLPIPAG